MQKLQFVVELRNLLTCNKGMYTTNVGVTNVGVSVEEHPNLALGTALGGLGSGSWLSGLCNNSVDEGDELFFVVLESLQTDRVRVKEVVCMCGIVKHFQVRGNFCQGGVLRRGCVRQHVTTLNFWQTSQSAVDELVKENTAPVHHKYDDTHLRHKSLSVVQSHFLCSVWERRGKARQLQG